jgi:hypothetical protein
VRLLVNEKKPADGKQFLAAAAGFQGCSKLGSVQSKAEARRPKEGRNPNCRIRSHRRGATAYRIKPFSGFGFQGCDPTLEQPWPGLPDCKELLSRQARVR